MGGVFTDKRTEPFAYMPYRLSVPGYAPSTGVWPSASFQTRLAQVQETRSFRTKGGEEEVTAESLREDARVTRNGFRTFSPQFDAGHEFYTTRLSAKISHPRVQLRGSSSRGVITYEGPLVPNINYFDDWSYPARTEISSSDISLYGNRAIKSTAPTAPQASAATAIGELMLDGLPSLIGASLLKDRVSAARKGGSEYLNVQFGWAPLIRDIRKIVSALKGANATLQQLQRDSGRNVRRRLSFPMSISTTSWSYLLSGVKGPFYDAGVDLFDVNSSVNGVPRQTVAVDQQTRTRIWFSGCYTYYIPLGESVMERLQRYEMMANTILGTRVTPETLWQLAPWSWLVDWKLAIGDAMSSMTLRSDPNLVIRYGYLMRHTIADKVYTVPYYQLKTGGQVGMPRLRLRRETKERVRATPFGFGIKETAISPFQWSILAALGMTKAPTSLR